MIRLISAALLASLPLSALAQDVPDSITADGAVSLQAARVAKDVLTESQVQVIKDISFQKSVVLTCEGFSVDDARFAPVFATAYPSAEEFDALDEPAQFKYQSVVMVVMGVFLGGNIAIATDDPASFCAFAKDEAAKKDWPNRIWAD